MPDEDEAAEQPTVAGESDATSIVPPPTQAAPELAWSLEEPSAEMPTQPWRSAWVMAAGVLACAAVIAVVVTIVGLVIDDRHDGDVPQLPATDATPQLAPAPAPLIPAPTPAPPTSAQPENPPAPPPTVTITQTPAGAAQPPAAASPPDADEVFRQGVLGIPGMRIVNWDVAEAGARSICGGFAHGMTRAQIIDEVQRDDPTFTPWQTSGMVNVALAAYCPQYEG